MDLSRNLCRVCLRTDEFVHLYDWNSRIHEIKEKVSYVECFWRCTRLNEQVHQGGGDQQDVAALANVQFLCSKCCNDLKNAYRFLIKAEEADRTLRTCCTKQAVTVKSEPMEQEATFVGSKKNSNSPQALQFPLPSCLEDNPLKEETCSYYNPDEMELSNQQDVLALSKVENERLPKSRVTKKGGRTRKVKAATKKVGKSVSMNLAANKLVKTASRRSRLMVTKNELAQIANDRKIGKRSRRSNKGDSDKEDTCEHCAKLLPVPKLKRHIAQCHGPKPVLLCYACPRIFNDSGSLHRHEGTHRERERKFKCELCELTFYSQLDCQRHRKTHDINRKPEFQCDQCDKSFLHKGSLKSHQLFHTGPLYECQLCPKRYPRAQDLQIHLRSHSGEMPYKCTKCDKAFALVHSLNVHLRKHDGVRYKCDVCGKEYTNGSTLSGHRREHTGLPRKCSVCDKGFTTRSKTLRHIKHVHKISDPAEMEKALVEVKLERVCRKPRLMSLTAAENQLKTKLNQK